MPKIISSSLNTRNVMIVTVLDENQIKNDSTVGTTGINARGDRARLYFFDGYGQ